MKVKSGLRRCDYLASMIIQYFLYCDYYNHGFLFQVVFLMAYMAYLSAETFRFSGIMAILFCGVVMKPYVQSNISRKSHITIKYFLKLLASSCEAVIFMFLGVALVQYEHNFNWKFIGWCVLFITLFR